MKNLKIVLLMLLALPAAAAEVAGVKVDEQTSVAGSEVALVGAGLRTRLFFQVYVIGLYVSNLKADPLAQPGPKRVQIHMLRQPFVRIPEFRAAEGVCFRKAVDRTPDIGEDGENGDGDEMAVK